MKNKDKKQNKIREPKIKEDALAVHTESEEHVTLQNVSEIDPELLTGKETAEISEPVSEEKESDQEKAKAEEPEEVTEAIFELDRLADRIAENSEDKKERIRRNAGIGFVVIAVLIVFIVAALSFFIDTGMDKSERTFRVTSSASCIITSF